MTDHTPPPLWPHQEAAIAFCEGRRASMLAMEMGTGKTRVAIELLDCWTCDTALVLAPLSVCSVWPPQVALHSSRDWRVTNLTGMSIAKRQALLPAASSLARSEQRPHLVICNYDALSFKSLAGALNTHHGWDALILDESHRIKSPSGKQSWACAEIAKASTRRLALTGTPMPHSPLDIYSQFRALDRTVFGWGWANFRSRYAVMGGYESKQVVGYRHLAELHEKLYANAFRVRADDVLTLPDVTEATRTCVLSRAAREVYDALVAQLMVEVENGKINPSNGLVRLLRLSQITGGTVGTDNQPQRIDSAKADLLGEVLTDIAADEPVVVFCRYTADLNAVHEQAAKLGRGSAELSGRRKDLATWQAGGPPILAVQIQSGGVGIDLTRARYCIYYSLSWSLGEFEQSKARVHRPGQERPVTYLYLTAEDTVDETIIRALARKARVVDSVIDRLREATP